MRMSSGSSRWKLKPRPGASNCIDDTPRSAKRIESLATEQLHLVTPSRDEAIVIERVVPAEPPAASVVARR